MQKTWGVTFIALVFVVAGASRATIAQAPGAKVTVEQHEGFMKTISASNASLGKKIMNNDLAEAAKDAQTLATTFGEVEKFWAQNNKADGVQWAQLGRTLASNLAGALAAGDTEKVAAARKEMSVSCNSCHKAYREGTPQTGGYTLKAGVVAP
jgi:cytochrome c556